MLTAVPLPFTVLQANGTADDATAVAGQIGTVPGAEISIRLIATSDLHAAILPYDYWTNRSVPGSGLSEIARQIEAARAEVPNSLLFDNGDFLQGNPLADYVATIRRCQRTHPVIAAFNALGYDAATLGNHEFNYGLPFLKASLSGAQFPVVSANIATRLGKSPARDKTLVPPYAILRRSVVDSAGRKTTLRIGVIGFAPPQIEVWDREHLNGRIRMRDIIAAAKAWLPRMRAQGAELIVALAHSGIGPLDAVDGMEDAATALAALPEIDAVIAGHSHLTFPGPAFAAARGIDPVRGLLAGKPAVMPGHSGSHVGIIDLRLSRCRTGPRRWRVVEGVAKLGHRSPALAKPSRLLREAVALDHRATLAWSRRVLGEARVALSTCFATAAPSAALELIAEAKVDYVRQALAGTAWERLPLLASAAPFRVGGRGGPTSYTEIPAGKLRLRNLSDLYMFPNRLVTLCLTGAEIADWLEQSASVFCQVAPGSRDTALLDPAVPAQSYEVIPGLAYAIDLSRPARFNAQGALVNPGARRIVGLCLGGRPLDPDQPVLLATNDHRANRLLHANALTGAGKTAPGPGTEPKVVLADSVQIASVLSDHVRARRIVGARPQRNWHFLPMPGTTVRLTSGVGSALHLADIHSFRPQSLGRDDEGFEHYRLHL